MVFFLSLSSRPRNQASWLYVGIDVCVRKAREGRKEGRRERVIADMSGVISDIACTDEWWITTVMIRQGEGKEKMRWT